MSETEASAAPPPPPPASSGASGPDPDARKWATITHLSALVGLLGNGIGFLVAPLVVWLLKRDANPYVDSQGKEAVNFQITMMIVMVICAILAFVFVGFLLIPIVGLVMVVLPIVAAVKTNDGQDFRYPFTIRFVK
ncbi:MAG: DUF4870 domain-containing protein [Gemmatimonadetes bacterium]|nr:DUF4870 domain-containing protein [Gemmatimonadota bacterium]